MTVIRERGWKIVKGGRSIIKSRTGIRHVISGRISRSQIWSFGAARRIPITLTTLTGAGVSSTRDGATRLCILSLSACSKTSRKSTGKSPFPFTSLPHPKSTKSTNQLTSPPSQNHRFRDIGYQHIPYFNCPNVPGQCSGCRTGLFTDGEDFLYKEDCRPNWFKYVGMG